MSEGIKLTQELMTDLISTIGKHDSEATQDMMVNIQYLAAIAGYLCADYPGPAAEREELLEHLFAFMKHVCNERIAGMEQPQTAEPESPPSVPAGKSVPTDDPAVGIWKPE